MGVILQHPREEKEESNLRPLQTQLSSNVHNMILSLLERSKSTITPILDNLTMMIPLSIICLHSFLKLYYYV